jgi:hypothetical protein
MVPSKLTSLYQYEVSCLPLTVMWNPSTPFHKVAVNGWSSTNGKPAVKWDRLVSLFDCSLLPASVPFILSRVVVLSVCCWLHLTSPSTALIKKSNDLKDHNSLCISLTAVTKTHTHSNVPLLPSLVLTGLVPGHLSSSPQPFSGNQKF